MFFVGMCGGEECRVAKKRSCPGIFKPGCEGPWMLTQECVLLGLVLSYNYGVESKYQAPLVP